MQCKLASLTIEEISGVDDPANQLPGFMLRKSKAGPTMVKVKDVSAFTLDGQPGLYIAHSWVETLRKRFGDDGVQAHIEEVLGAFLDATEKAAVKKAARTGHDGRKHPHSGKFVPMTEPHQTKNADALVWTNANKSQPKFRWPEAT